MGEAPSRRRPSLADLQQWMIGAVQGVEGGALSHDAEELILPSAALSAAGRLDLYRRSYFIRLLECLRDMHPALCYLLGQSLFDAFALEYLAARPPRSYTLFDLDEGFAAHLIATRPAEDECGAPAEPWTEMIIDVVRLERTFLELYDGPGVEGNALPTAQHVLGLPADVSVTVSPVPCARLFRSRYPIGDYVMAVRRGEQPTVPLPALTWLALVRRDYVVNVVTLEPTSHAALGALFGGADSSDAARRSGVEHHTVRRWIADWADHGLFTHIRPALAPSSARPAAATTTREGIPCS